MQSKSKIQRFFQTFHSLEISWQIYTIALIYIIIMVIAFVNDWKIGLLLLLLLFTVVFFFYINMDSFIQNINTLANDLSKEIRYAHENSYNRSPMSILFYDKSQRVKWLNTSMQNIIGQVDVLGEKIAEIKPSFDSIMNLEDDKEWHIIKYNEKYFKVLHQKNDGRVFLIDVNEEMLIKEKHKNNLLVFGYLLLDEYKEVIETMDDQQEAIFDAMVLKEINQWTSNYKIYNKRIDEDKFILLMNMSTLDELERDKFKFFEDLKKENYAKNILLSISIGIAYPNLLARSYRIEDLANEAQTNLELALARGGDQIVVRSNNDRARFYGGKTQQTLKRSNIRSRMVFQALKTQIKHANQVYISGHKTPDLDSIGSSIGMYKIVKQYNENAKIILDRTKINNDIKDLLLHYNVLENSDMFTDINNIKEQIEKNTLLIMVDHHRPILSEATEIIDDCDIVIIDHHRRGEEFPNNPVLTYIEPNASSTGELITEFFMNMDYKKENLTSFESTALLSGIIIDTNNFVSRTGSKTFDAASFLKSRSADTSLIYNILKEDISVIKRKNQMIERMEIIKGYGITYTLDKEIIDNVVASQTADTMLDIKGIEASFVIYRRTEETIGISARSLGKINVQVIMERMGGGGHLSNAATQINNKTIDEVYQQLKKEIKLVQED